MSEKGKMTRKEKERLVLNALGLKVGDVVYITLTNLISREYEIREYDYYFELNSKEYAMSIAGLLDFEFEKITPKKKKGELKCSSFESCHECPLYTLPCENGTKDVLYDMLKSTKKYYKLDPRIYEAYKQVLDDEVEE